MGGKPTVGASPATTKYQDKVDMIFDNATRYGRVTRILHWGMALLFAAQFLSAGLRVILERGNELRDMVWSYHTELGITLFLLVLFRGVWGLLNLSRRPGHDGLMGKAAKLGHLALYLLMIIVPATRLLAAAGGKRGLSYLGIEVFPPRDIEIAWTQVAAEWHGEMGWVLALLVVGHIVMAVGWHHFFRKDGSLARMAG